MSELGKKPILGISMGDPNGVGPEIILKTFRDPRMLDDCTPVVFGSAEAFEHYRELYKWKTFKYERIESLSEISKTKLNLLEVCHDFKEISPGANTQEAGRASFQSLRAAVEALKNQEVDALITAPINKHNIQSEEFSFPGHTEFFAAAAEQSEALMLLVHQNLRVGMVTGHVPLKEVSDHITAERIRSRLRMMEQSMRDDFNISHPKIAVLGLNPHAGDRGLLGKEERELIEPLLAEMQENGHHFFGPFAADGFFGSGGFRNFDAILAMYHDQALAPFKALAFNRGVNFTAGLPFVRTSPDHGTGYDIAGRGIAKEGSFREAVFCALDVLRSRKSLQLKEEEEIS
jgi:4-hydroxythreonine-4-phosphate dehydrogenase